MTQLSSVALALISPLGSALALGGIALMLAQRGIKRAAWVAGIAALVWLWVWSTPLASVWLLGSIEGRYPPLAMQAVPSAQAIVVLGGALSPPGPGRQYPDLSGGSDRVWHAARLFHAGKAPLVVMSGGGDPALSQMSEAQAMRDFIQDLGVPVAAVVLEPDSRNTRENARFTAMLLRQRQINQVLLVTSALHMRRALAHFRAEGLTVIPLATDHTPLDASGGLDLLPDAGALEGSGRAFKELIGQAIWARAQE